MHATRAYAYRHLYSRVRVIIFISRETNETKREKEMWKAPWAPLKLPLSRYRRVIAVSCPLGISLRDVRARWNPFISMGLSRVSEAPSTDDVIDVGRLMPYWACIVHPSRASEPSAGNTIYSSRVAASP